MRKLVFCTNSTGIMGGREKTFADKLNYLVANTEYKIYVISRLQQNKPHFYPLSIPSEQFYDLNIDYCIEGNSVLRFIKRIIRIRKHRINLAKIVHKINPDILVLNSQEDVFATSYIHKNVRIIYEEHNVYNYFTNKLLRQSYSGYSLWLRLWKHFFMNRLFEYKLSKMDAIISLTHKAGSYHTNENVYILNNPLGEEYRTTGRTLKTKKIIAVGRLSAEKRFNLFIDACALIKDKLLDWTFHIYGDGEEYDNLTEKIRDYGLNNTMFIHKGLSELLAIYQESDICIVTSLFESYGMVLVEAMSQYVACISFAINFGPLELIKNNLNGILVMDDNVNKLAEVVLQVAGNVHLRNQIANKGHDSVVPLFLNNTMPKYVFLLEKLAKK